MKHSKFKIQKLIPALCIFNFIFLVGCSQPVLESEQCIESRDTVKRFYSFHFGNEMKPSAENLAERKKFLSKELQENLARENDSKKDYFTQTDDYPKAFRVGSCENSASGRAKFEILLFWRRNEINIQREIKVEAVRENGKWLVDKVASK